MIGAIKKKKKGKKKVLWDSELNKLKASQQDCLLIADHNQPRKRNCMAYCRRYLEDTEGRAVTGAAAWGELLSNMSALGVC